MVFQSAQHRSLVEDLLFVGVLEEQIAGNVSPQRKNRIFTGEDGVDDVFGDAGARDCVYSSNASRIERISASACTLSADFALAQRRRA